IIVITDKTTHQVTRYPVSAFTEPLPPGMLLSGLEEPALTQIIKPGATQRFFVRISEAAGSPPTMGTNLHGVFCPPKVSPQTEAEPEGRFRSKKMEKWL